MLYQLSYTRADSNLARGPAPINVDPGPPPHYYGFG